MIDITYNGAACVLPPLPRHHPVIADLLAQTTYTHKEHLRGAQAMAQFGKSQGTLFSRRCFLHEDKDNGGRWLVNAGLVHRVLETFRRHGLPVRVHRYGLSESAPQWDQLAQRVQFRPLQQEALQALVAQDFGGLKASTGFGKGFCIRCYCHLFPQDRIDIVTDAVNVVWTLHDYLKPYVPDLGVVGDGSHKPGRVTLYTADSLHHADGLADHLLVDEVHMVCGARSIQRFLKYRRARRRWFSATPTGRGDGADLRVEAAFGPAVMEIPYQVCVQHGLVVQIEVNWHPVDLPFDPMGTTENPTSRARWGIWRNEPRNVVLANLINDLHPEDQTLVLVDKVEHLCHLLPKLPGFVPAFGDGNSSIEEAKKWVQEQKIDGCHLEDRRGKNRQLRRDFREGRVRKVIATSVLDTGVDFPELCEIVRTDPFGSTEQKDLQAPGRGSRLSEGKMKARLHDTIDRFNDGLYRRTCTRRTNYRTQGWDEVGWH